MRIRSPWNRKFRQVLIDQLEMYVSAGLPLADSLEQIGESMRPSLKSSTERIRTMVESGQTLSGALASEARFSPALVGLIACGEASGSLGESLRAGRSILEREDELIKRCVSAAAYPAIIGLAAVLLVIGLTQGIMPQIIPLLTSLRTELPLLTRLVMRVSDVVASSGLYIAGGLVVSGILTSLGYRVFIPFRSLVHSSLLRVPLVGGLARSYSATLFLQSFGSLAKSGMSADVAYERAASAVPLIPIRHKLLAKVGAIKHGYRVGEVLSTVSLPGCVVPLVSAGEASGDLAGSLLKASVIIDREMDHTLKRLTVLIEPLMMIVMGCLIGAIALSIMMPIYDVSKTLQR